MSITLAELMNDTAEGVAHIGSFDVKFTYLPNVMTAEKAYTVRAKIKEDGLASADASDDDDKGVEEANETLEQLAEALVSWNLVETEGKKFPPTTANLKRVPIKLVYELASIVAGNAKPGEASGSFADG